MFIVSVHRNTEAILRAAWIDAVIALVDHLGPEHVYVSAVESGSQDYTKEALSHLQTALDARGAGHSISLGTTVWGQLEELYAWPDPEAPAADRPGWIWDAEEGHFALRRIPYLARVRNQAMAPLLQLAETEGRRFDQVLWINDVAFDVRTISQNSAFCFPLSAFRFPLSASVLSLALLTTQTSDVLTLLDTRGGHYAAACAVDFMSYPRYYDTFALRDEYGEKATSAFWPWFESSASRADVRAGRPVRVQSCWNGMIAFDALPFYGSTGQAGQPEQTSDVDLGREARPLMFRGIDDSLAEMHLEASECCLIHADNPLSGADSTDSNYGVWLNPNVRVAYSVPVYNKVRRDVFPGAGAAVLGMWAHRWDRIMGQVQYLLEAQAVVRRLRQWRVATPEGQPERSEAGVACLINEMQIMWQNGWKHL